MTDNAQVLFVVTCGALAAGVGIRALVDGLDWYSRWRQRRRWK